MGRGIGNIVEIRETEEQVGHLRGTGSAAAAGGRREMSDTTALLMFGCYQSSVVQVTNRNVPAGLSPRNVITCPSLSISAVVLVK